ncbi:MAG: insulinase family protein [Gemmatimonadota bacterium]|nr:insulinase family protein [Gemmatimonadota bacterium]
MRWTDSVVREVLPNGLTLLVQRDSSVPVAAVVTHVKAGYFDEPDAWAGIAHVLEHMFFKGTGRLGPGALARETQRLGGYLNAGTIYDKTVYYAVVPSAGDALTRAVELQADALMRLALDPDELARELEVIIQEAKRKLDTPGAVTVETLYELLFRVHRMRRWRIGTETTLRGLTVADVRAYYESRYTPDRVVVALTGDLDVDRTLALGRRVYGSWDRPPGPVGAPPAEPAAREGAVRVLRGDVRRPLAAVGWRTVGPLHPDTPALDVAAGILGMGRGSWLVQAVRTPGLASGVGAGHYTPGDVGVFDLSLTSDPDRVESAVARCLEVCAALAETGPDPAQLDRVRAMTDTHWARRFEPADGRATVLAEFEALGGYALADDYHAALSRVGPDDVRRVARTYLTADAVSAVFYLPPDAPTRLAEASWPPAVAPRGVAPVPPAVALAVPSRRPVPPTTHVGGTTVRHLAGADVLARSRPGTGLVAVGVFFTGVTSTETPEAAGISRLLARTALRGAAGMSAEQLAVRAESLGGSIGAVVDSQILGWALTVPVAAARDATALLHALAAEPALTAPDVAVERDLQAGDAARLHDDMYQYPVQRVLREAFPGHAYGLPLLGEPETVRALDGDALRRWLGRLHAARALVVAVGDREPEALLDLGDAFADWPGRVVPAANGVPVWAAGRAGEPRQKAQTALAMAFPAPPAPHEERFALVVLGALLSGLAGRLFDELRERRALAYTVAAAPWLRRDAGALLTYIATSPERESEARDAMLAELTALPDAPLGEEELERARNYAAGIIPLRRQHAGAVAAELVSAWAHGTLAGFEDEEGRRRAVTADAIRDLARRVVEPATRAEFVVRGTGRSR